MREVKRWMVVTRVVRVTVDVDEGELADREEGAGAGWPQEPMGVLISNVKDLPVVAPECDGFVPYLFDSKEEADGCVAKLRSFDGY